MSLLRPQRGLSLLELLLVLALLVVIGAIAAPAIGRFMKTQQLRDSAALIRGEWARARVQAMKSGRIHVFRFEQDGRHYIVDFWMADDDALEAGDDSAVAKSNSDAFVAESDNFASLPGSKQLPEGIRFLLGDAERDARDARIESQLETAPPSASGTGWSLPILFYSDGTTSSAEVVLANDRNDAIRIELRGLTGIGTVSDVLALDAHNEAPTP